MSRTPIFILLLCNFVYSASNWYPGKFITAEKYAKAIENFGLLHENAETRTAVTQMNHLLVKETASALQSLISNTKSQIYFVSHTHPDEREKTFYSNRRGDDLAGLRVVIQNSFLDPGSRESRLVSAIFATDIDPRTMKLKFLKSPPISVDLKEGKKFVAYPPRYTPRILHNNKSFSYDNAWKELRVKFPSEVEFLQKTIKRNRLHAPKPDAFRIRVEVEKDKFVGLSYTAFENKVNGKIDYILPGATSIHHNELYKNITVWARADHCLGCHEEKGRFNRVSYSTRNKAKLKEHHKMRGYREFIQYVRNEFGNSTKTENILRKPSVAILPVGLTTAIQNHYKNNSNR